MRLAIFLPSFGDGGVERMLVNLAGGLAQLGTDVDFLTRRRDSPFLDGLPEAVKLIELGAGGSLKVLVPLVRYLRAARPDFVLCGKDRAGRSALHARRLSGVHFALIMRPGTTVSERMARRGIYRRWRAFRLIRGVYRQAAAVVGNSAGVVADIKAIADLPDDRMHLIRNPVVTADLQAQAAADCPHPWFAPGQPPVIVAVGGLRRQKGFDTLIRAFAALRQTRRCHLMILGEGHLRESLARLAAALGVADAVAMPGFDPRPYPMVARAALFVLASRWEGSPNALTEALALGTPVVATDCPSGPREILDGGRVAPLVPVDDAPALAEAMLHALVEPGDRARRIAAVSGYTVDACAARYLALLEALQAPRI